jgi:glycine/D-amino acid oxidase-like deaminating enzyme
VAGGGLAGSLLAWRLAQRPGTEVDLMTAGRPAADATAASGGAVRAYERWPAQRELAIASLTELLASPILRQWGGYRETGFACIREPGADLPGALAEIDRELPGSAELISAAEAFRAEDGSPAWAGQDSGVAVRERRAGYISPGRLRDAVIEDFGARADARVRQEAFGAGLGTRGYDAVVLAAGPWTTRLLPELGLPAGGYRTRSIQYTIYDAGPWRPGGFTDDRTGLYGRPDADGGLLLGVPTTEWDVPPDAAQVTGAWHDQARQLAAGCFPLLKLGRARQRVAAADCYCDPPILALRELDGQAPRTFTFTGGSGGCVKTALAASQRAAGQLQALS